MLVAFERLHSKFKEQKLLYVNSEGMNIDFCLFAGQKFDEGQ